MDDSRIEEGVGPLLRAAVATLMRNKAKIFFGVLAGAAAGAFIAQSQPPTYVATTTILLEPVRIPAASGREAPFIQPLDLNRADTELQIVRSERLLRRVFDRLDIVAHPDVQNAGIDLTSLASRAANTIVSEALAATGLEAWRGTADPAPATGPPIQDERSAFGAFTERFFARRIGQSYVLEIGYSSTDPELAARVANAAASAYLLQSIEGKMKTARAGSELAKGWINFLEEQAEATAAAMGNGEVPSLATPGADGRVISVASVPLVATFPRPKLAVAAGATFGFAGVLFLLALRAAFDARIHTSADLSRAARLPCLAELSGSFTGRRRRPMLPAEAARDIYSAIRACLPEDATGPFAVAFVAWHPGVGQSASALAFAHWLDGGGTNACVLDADVRNTAQSLSSGQDYGPRTLADLVVGGAEPSAPEMISRDGVKVVPVRSRRADVNRFIDFNGRGMAEHLAALRADRHIVADLAPLSTPDGIAFARLFDVIVLVARSGHTTTDEVRQGAAALRLLEVPVAGTILTAARKQRRN